MLSIMPWGKELDIKHLDRMQTRICDGVFMCRELKTEQKALQGQVRDGNIPFVMLESELDNISSVAFDYQVGMEKAFEELLNKGHCKIAFAGHHGDTHKWNAYRKCCLNYQLEPIEYSFDLTHAFQRDN